MKRRDLVDMLQREVPPDFDIGLMAETEIAITLNLFGDGETVRTIGKEVKIVVKSVDHGVQPETWRPLTDLARDHLRYMMERDIQNFYNDPDEGVNVDELWLAVKGRREACSFLGLVYDNVVREQATAYEIRRVNEMLGDNPKVEVPDED